MLNEHDRQAAEQAGILDFAEKICETVSLLDNVDDVTFDFTQIQTDDPYVSIVIKHHISDERYVHQQLKIIRPIRKIAKEHGFVCAKDNWRDDGERLYIYLQPEPEVEEAPAEDNGPAEVEETPEMYVERVALEERLERLREGLCAHQEYYAAEINKFANLPITTYLDRADELEQLAYHAGISVGRLRNMTFKQVARNICDDVYHYGDTCWCSAGEELALPLIRAYNGQTRNDEKATATLDQKKPQQIPLDDRLKGCFTLENFALPNMDVASFMLFMDEMVESGGWRFENEYLCTLQQYGEHTIASLLAESSNLSDSQREDIYYSLLIKPFGWLDEFPRDRWKTK